MARRLLLAATIGGVAAAVFLLAVRDRGGPAPRSLGEAGLRAGRGDQGLEFAGPAGVLEANAPPLDGSPSTTQSTTPSTTSSTTPAAAARAVSVRGTLRAASREGPIALTSRAFVVRAVAGASSRTIPSRTDAGASFDLPGFLPGVYELGFECDGFVPLARSVTVARGIASPHLDVLLVAGIRVRGQVRDLDENPRGDCVVIWRDGDDSEREREAVVDETGAWELTLDAPGRYEVCALPRILRALWLRSDWKVVTVREERIQRFDLTVDLGRALRVVVLDEDRGVAGATVSCRVTTSARGVSVVLPPTDARGQTRVSGLPAAGALVLEVTAPSAGTAATTAGSRTARVELDLGSLPSEARLRLD